MSLFVLDTDHRTLLARGHPAVVARLRAVPRKERVATILSVEEQLTGWYTQVRAARDDQRLAWAYQRLAETLEFFRKVRVLPFTIDAIRRYRDLRKQLPRLGRFDLSIAAIVLENNAILVTRNTGDFQQIPGLALDDWTRP
jgi:tRNA(fMet)-specific endonuclease VapC